MGIDTNLKLRLGIVMVEMNQMDAALGILEPYEGTEPEACLYTGRIHLSRADYPKALQKLTTYIEKVGASEPACYYLGCAQAGTNLKKRPPDYTVAIQAFEKALGYQGKFANRAHLQLGKIYQALDLRQQALEHFQACSTPNDTRVEACIGLAYLYFSMDRAAEARVLLSELQNASIQDPRLAGLSGMAAELDGDFAAAELAYSQAGDTASLGIVQYRLGRMADALKNLEKARAAGNDSDRVLYYCGLAYIGMDNLVSGIDVWERLYQRNPSDQALGANIGRLWYRLGCWQIDHQDDERAAKSWENYYAVAPTDRAFCSALAKLYLRIAAHRLGSPTGKQALLRARELGLDETGSLLADGLWLNGEGDFAGGAAKLEQYLQHYPQDAPAHYNAGVALARTGQHEAARAHFLKAYKTGTAQEGRAAGWALAAVCAAQEDWLSVLQFAPGDAGSDPGRNLLLLAASIKIGRMEQAASIAARSQSAACHNLLASVFAAAGQPDQALGEYEQSLKIDADDEAARQGATAVYTDRAVSAGRNQDWHAALSHLNRALALGPRQPYPLRLKKALQRAAGQWAFDPDHLEFAIQSYEKMQQADLSRADVAHQLAILNHQHAIELEENGHHQERAQAWNRAFANWAVALLSDEYWDQWAKDRRQVYELEISPDEIEKLRGEVVRGRIRELQIQYMQSYFSEGKTEDASWHRRCAAQWSLEWNTARAVRDTIRFLTQNRVTPKASLASGPLFWEQYQLRAQVTQMADDALRLDAAFQPARVIRDALSPTGLAKTLLDEAQVDDCIDLLDQHLRANPGDGSARALMAKALLAKLRAQAGSDPRGAVATAEKARQYGANPVETEEIIYVAVMEAATAAVRSGRFVEAENLLHEAIQIMPARRPLQEKYAEVVCARVDDLVQRQLAEIEQNGDLEVVIQRLLEARQTLEAVEPSSGGYRQRVQKEIERVNETGTRACKLRATQLDDQATGLIRRGYVEAQSGNRAQARQTMQQAQAILGRAQQLDPDNRAIEKNLQVAREQMARLG